MLSIVINGGQRNCEAVVFVRWRAPTKVEKACGPGQKGMTAWRWMHWIRRASVALVVRMLLCWHTLWMMVSKLIANRTFSVHSIM